MDEISKVGINNLGKTRELWAINPLPSTRGGPREFSIGELNVKIKKTKKYWRNGVNVKKTTH